MAGFLKSIGHRTTQHDQSCKALTTHLVRSLSRPSKTSFPNQPTQEQSHTHSSSPTMRLASFLVLIVVYFAASFTNAEDAALTSRAAPTPFAERIRGAIEVRRLRRSPEVAKEDGEERAGVNAAAARNRLKSGRGANERATSAAVSAWRPLTKGQKAFIATLALGLGATGGAVGVYALYKKMAAHDK
jgi:hypothetical protein